MFITKQELYLKCKDYKTPHIKIQTELKNKNLFLIKRGFDERNLRKIRQFYLM